VFGAADENLKLVLSLVFIRSPLDIGAIRAIRGLSQFTIRCLDAITLEHGVNGELLRSLLHRRGESWRVLPEEIFDALTGELARALGVENWGDSEIAEQLGEASDEDLALTRNMSAEAKRRLLLSVQDRVTWPLHPFVDGTTGPLDKTAFLQSDYPLQAIFAGTVRLVRPSVDANVAAQQSKFVDSWGPNPLLATALEQPDPHRFMNPILDALDTCDQFSPELTDHLRRKPWLALTSGPTRREDILDLPEDVALEADRLLTNQAERTFVTTAMVPLETRTRPAWNHIRALVQAESAALDGLALLLDGDPSIALAPNSGSEVAPIEVFAQLAMSDFDLPLRSWPLFASTARHFQVADIEARLFPKLRGPMSADNLRAVLQRITSYDRNAADGRQLARRIFAFYLKAALSSDDKSSILSAIELPNRVGGSSRRVGRVANLSQAPRGRAAQARASNCIV